ncbi:MAG: hypothetical protein AABW52_06245, partial [Nanoarchaeota archaeon]
GVRTEFDKGFMNQFTYLTYCGMPNSDTFCITRELLEYEGHGFLIGVSSTPLFFSKETEEIIILRTLKILELDSQKIVLEDRIK